MLGVDDLQTSTYPSGGTLLDAYIRTIITGRVGKIFVYDNFSTLLEVREEVMRLALLPEQAEQSILAQRYFARLTGPLGYCHTFTMCNGYVGVAWGPIRSSKLAHLSLGYIALTCCCRR